MPKVTQLLVHGPKQPGSKSHPPHSSVITENPCENFHENKMSAPLQPTFSTLGRWKRKINHKRKGWRCQSYRCPTEQGQGWLKVLKGETWQRSLSRKGRSILVPREAGLGTAWADGYPQLWWDWGKKLPSNWAKGKLEHFKSSGESRQHWRQRWRSLASPCKLKENRRKDSNCSWRKHPRISFFQVPTVAAFVTLI